MVKPFDSPNNAKRSFQNQLYAIIARLLPRRWYSRQQENDFERWACPVPFEIFYGTPFFPGRTDKS